MNFSAGSECEPKPKGSELANFYLDMKIIWLAVYNFMMPSAYNLGLMVSNLKSYLFKLLQLKHLSATGAFYRLKTNFKDLN